MTRLWITQKTIIKKNGKKRSGYARLYVMQHCSDIEHFLSQINALQKIVKDKNDTRILTILVNV